MKKTFGIFRVIFNLGFIIGPLAGSIVSVYRFSDIFLFASVFRFLELMIVILMVKPSSRTNYAPPKNNENVRTHPGAVSRVDRKLLFFSLSVMFLAMIGTQVQVSLPIFAVSTGGITIAQYGYIYALNGLVVVAGQFLINRLFSKIGDITSMLAGTVLYMAAFIIAGFSSSFLPLAGLMVIYSLGEDIIAPLENAIVGSFAPLGKVGFYISVKSSFWSAGSVLGPTLGSIVIFLLPFRPLVSWGIMDMFGGASMVMLLAFRNHSRRELPGSAATA
jgi:MFS family permease